MPKADEPKELPMGTIRSESKGVDLWIQCGHVARVLLGIGPSEVLLD